MERNLSFSYGEEGRFNRPTQQAPAYDDVVDSPASDIPAPLGTRNAGPPPPPVHKVPFRENPTHPGAHPSSNFEDLQSQRQYGQTSSPPRKAVPMAAEEDGRYWGREVGYMHSQRQPHRQSVTTPGADNMGSAAAGGGMAGLAMGAASSNERESGVQALRDIDDLFGGRAAAATPSERHYDPYDEGDMGQYGRPLHQRGQTSESSITPLAPAAAAAGVAGGAAYAGSHARGMSDGMSSPARPPNNTHYSDSPYNQYSNGRDPTNRYSGPINPNDIEDDGDDGLNDAHDHSRRSWMGGNSNHSRDNVPLAAVGAGAGAAAGGAAAGGLFSKRDRSGNYASVPGGGSANDPASEKSRWLAEEKRGRKRMTWIVSGIIAVIVILAIVGGVVGTLVSRNKANTSTAASVAADNKDDLSKDSDEIKKLLNNPNLHKVFPGVDYTPLNAQYPDCLKSPPSQNNVTRDMAVLSQMTNTIRLYGTDCNQTEMALHAIDRLDLKDKMKIWLGVWLDNNATSNTRQLAQMWTILDRNGSAPFAGVVVGNEVLFRKDMTVTQLAGNLTAVKKNLTDHNWKLDVATSDLGDNWSQNPTLAQSVDVVMSNIHPFFGGVPVAQAAGWTYSFWQNNDVPLTQGTSKKNVISEVGWPSDGGNDCAPASTCPDKTSGAVASIDNMNKFMADFVCQSLTNGTNYFWFEAFDEPWKVQYNTPTQQWEDKWGLMDVSRNLKSGVKIPDCGGKTVS